MPQGLHMYTGTVTPDAVTTPGLLSAGGSGKGSGGSDGGLVTSGGNGAIKGKKRPAASSAAGGRPARYSAGEISGAGDLRAGSVARLVFNRSLGVASSAGVGGSGVSSVGDGDGSVLVGAAASVSSLPHSSSSPGKKRIGS